MRFALALAALVVASSAMADCKPRSIGQSENAYANALLKRMRPLGVSDIDRVGKVDERDHYAVLGADFSLFLTPDSGIMREIGFVLSEPSSSGETEKMMTGVAFTLGQLSGTAEGEIKDKLYSDSARHSSGTWAEKFGSAVAVITRSDDGTVAKIGLLTCS